MKKLVYIAHPIGGIEINENIRKVKTIYKHLPLENEVIPFAPYLVAVQSLDDLNYQHRAIGFEQNKVFFERKIIDELWVYGMSAGVQQEIDWAVEFGIKVVGKINDRVEMIQLSIFEDKIQETASGLLEALNLDRKKKDLYYPQYTFEHNGYTVLMVANKEKQTLFNVLDNTGNIPDGFCTNWRYFIHVAQELNIKIDKK